MKTHKKDPDRMIVLPAEGDVATLASVVRTLTHKLERERGRADDLERKSIRQAAVLEAVSHDIRGPTSAVLGAALTLQRTSTKLPEEIRERLLDSIVNGARKIEHLLSDLLDMDRIEHRVLSVQRRDINVGAVLQRVVDEVGINHHVTITYPAHHVVGKVDEPKLERIAENLLINALRYTPEGTRVWVSVDPTDDGVIVVVEDEGPGVPDSLKERVFEPFEHGDLAGSTGLGLSIVRGFAEAQGGRAWVEDRPGGGASFKVFLPA